MNLARRVMEPKEPSRRIWDGILLVVDASNVMCVSINVVSKSLVANLNGGKIILRIASLHESKWTNSGQAVSNGLERNSCRQMKGKVNRINQCQGSTWTFDPDMSHHHTADRSTLTQRVANYGNMGYAMSRQRGFDSSEDRWRSS
jgi:hypothetical protein